MSVAFSAEEVFSLAMEIERSGHAYYKTVADAAKDKELSELFEFLAEQENRHYRFFERLKSQAPVLDVDVAEWEQATEYIKATTDSRFFIGEDRAIALARSAEDAAQAIDYAIGFEKDTLLFFYELLNVTSGESKKAAKNIVDEEKRHVTMLSERRAKARA